MLDCGADVAATNQNQSTALHTAAVTGVCGTMRILLDAWASVGAKNVLEKTPLHKAVNPKS